MSFGLIIIGCLVLPPDRTCLITADVAGLAPGDKMAIALTLENGVWSSGAANSLAQAAAHVMHCWSS